MKTRFYHFQLNDSLFVGSHKVLSRSQIPFRAHHLVSVSTASTRLYNVITNNLGVSGLSAYVVTCIQAIKTSNIVNGKKSLCFCFFSLHLLVSVLGFLTVKQELNQTN